ncbi:MAG: hypothetical protein ACREOR_02810 [Candidatus Binatia bacterium]
MKKSAKVTLAFLSSFAAAVMNGCDSNDSGDWVEAKRCVDHNTVVVEDRLCDETIGRGGGHGGYYHYYGGRGYYPGDIATGGGRIGQPGVSYRSPSQVARGGFGSTGKAFVSRGGSIGS